VVHHDQLKESHCAAHGEKEQQIRDNKEMEMTRPIKKTINMDEKINMDIEPGREEQDLDNYSN
jgi:hypothetical protein